MTKSLSRNINFANFFQANVSQVINNCMNGSDLFRHIYALQTTPLLVNKINSATIDYFFFFDLRRQLLKYT